MRLVVGAADRGPAISAAALVGALVVLTLSVVAQPSVMLIAASAAMLLPLAYAHRWLLAWRRLIALLVLVILFIPIKRYALGGGLPFDLEPYRLLVMLIVAGWFVSLLIDPRVRARKTGLEGPIVLIAIASLLSEVTNPDRIRTLNVQPEVVKSLMFLLSFFLISFLIVSVIKTRADVERLLEILCAGAGVVGIFALIEYRTHFNVFDHIRVVMPFLQPTAPDGPGIGREGQVRVFASAQHPIALGGLFVMLTPLALYLAMRPGKKKWWFVTVPVLLGALSSVSRTSIVMFAAAGLVFLVQRPRETLKAWPLLVPALVVVQFALPGVMGSLKGAFFPKGGLVAEQTAHPGWSGSGRLADISPTIEEWKAHPFFGEGFGTRQPQKHPDTAILDDQWLKTIVETGLLGALGWLWLFVRSIRRLARQAREDQENGGWLEVALGAAVAAFATGMAFYDAFSFIQVTVMLFIVLGLGAALSQSARKPTQRRPAAALGR